MNDAKVFVLMAGLTALCGVVGGAAGGQEGMVAALALAGVGNLVAYFNSASMVLRAYGAQVVDPDTAPELHAMVDRLRQRAGLPMPRVAVAPHDQPNAFATGRNPNNAVVCVTRGLLELVDRDELEGVLAHELGHVKNRDMLLQTASATLAGAVSNVAQPGALGAARVGREGRAPVNPLIVLLGPLAAMIPQFAISRQREFKADATGAEICGKPLALASALEKLEQAARRIPMRIPMAVAPLAQVNPLAAFGGAAKLFSTHPSTAERIARLRAIATRMGQASRAED